MIPLSISRRKPPVRWCEAGAIRIPGARATRPMKTLIVLRFRARSRGHLPACSSRRAFLQVTRRYLARPAAPLQPWRPLQPTFPK